MDISGKSVSCCIVFILFLCVSIFIDLSSATKCEENNAFRSLRSCRQFCRLKFGLTTEKPSEESSTRRFQYKVVKISKNKFSQFIQSHNPRFSKHDYFMQNETITLCYPLDNDFYYCNKNQIPKNDYKFVNENHSVKIDIINKIFPVGKFFIHFDNAIVCQSPPWSTPLAPLHLAASVLSAATLTITLIICAKFKKINHALIFHVLMLWIGYILLSIKISLTTPPPYFCVITAPLQQFSFLSAFFWLNVQSFMLQSSITKKNLNFDKTTSFKNMTFHFTYAFGIPCIISLSAILAEVFEVDAIFPYFNQNCWFLINDRKTSFLFYYGPMTMTLMINLVFFIRIIYHLRILSKEIHQVNREIYKQMLWLLLKLVVILGFCWFTKIAFWGIGVMQSIWSYLDIITYFQGVFVLLVYVCNYGVISRFCTRKFSVKCGTKS